MKLLRIVSSRHERVAVCRTDSGSVLTRTFPSECSDAAIEAQCREKYDDAVQYKRQQNNKKRNSHI